MNDLSTQEKIAILQCVDLFAMLSRDELEVTAINSEVVKVPMGTVLFGENSPSRALYIVRDGEVLITKHKDYENDLDLAQYLPVECFGELDLFAARRREATAVTVRDSSILVYPKGGMDFPDVLQAYPKASARMLHNLISIISKRIRSVHKRVGQESKWIEGLKRSLYVDRLTGLYNQHYLMDEMQEVIPEDVERACMLLIKPDNFKYLNDKYGHDVGDKVLVLIAIFIQSILREKDIALRYWGDEFLVVLMNARTEDAVAIAKDIGRALHEIDLTHMIKGDRIALSVSIGIAEYPDETPSGIVLTKLAYQKMQVARKKGGNRISIKHLTDLSSL